MPRGRPPKGPELVLSLDGSDLAKLRLKVILQTLAGELSVSAACSTLNISEARFHELRAELLQAAVSHLEPRPKGRPPENSPQDAAAINALKAQNQELKIELRAAQIREEIALVMPHILKPSTPAQKLGRQQRLDALQDQLDDLDPDAPSKKKTSPLSNPSSAATNSTPKDSNRSGR